MTSESGEQEGPDVTVTPASVCLRKGQLLKVLALLADAQLISEAAHGDMLTLIVQDDIEDANETLQAVVLSLPQELQSKCRGIMTAFGTDDTTYVGGQPSSSSVKGRCSTFTENG